MSHSPVATFLRSLLDDRAEHLEGAPPDWTSESWHAALAVADAVPTVRRVALPELAWDVAGLADLRRVFPHAASFHLKQVASPTHPRATLADLLSTFWNAPLRALHTQGFRADGELPDGVPGFAGTLEALHLHGARPGVVERIIDRMGTRSRLREVTLAVDALRDGRVALESDTLDAVTVHVRKRPAGASLAFACRLPVLRELSLVAPRDDQTALDVASLCAVVVGARSTLRRVTLRAPHAWRHAVTLAETLAAAPGASRPELVVERLPRRELDTPEARAEDFAHLQRVRALGFAVDPVACLAVVDRPEHLHALAAPLSGLDALDLVGDVHGFLLRDPSRFATFAAARTLKFFDAGALTRDGLVALLAALPALTSLRLYNNHNPHMDGLTVRSASLESMYVTHFHALREFDVDAPALRELELDNCEVDPLDTLTARGVIQPVNTTIYGAYGERFLAALLEGDVALRLPALRVLSLRNNPIGFGSLQAIESMRVDVACRAGHPALRALHLANVPHLRTLTLRHLPALTTLSVHQCDDQGLGTTWLESADLAGLPDGCDVTLCAQSPGRAGI